MLLKLNTAAVAKYEESYKMEAEFQGRVPSLVDVFFKDKVTVTQALEDAANRIPLLVSRDNEATSRILGILQMITKMRIQSMRVGVDRKMMILMMKTL